MSGGTTVREALVEMQRAVRAGEMDEVRCVLVEPPSAAYRSL